MIWWLHIFGNINTICVVVQYKFVAAVITNKAFNATAVVVAIQYPITQLGDDTAVTTRCPTNTESMGSHQSQLPGNVITLSHPTTCRLSSSYFYVN